MSSFRAVLPWVFAGRHRKAMLMMMMMIDTSKKASRGILLSTGPGVVIDSLAKWKSPSSSSYRLGEDEDARRDDGARCDSFFVYGFV
ncbi:peptidase [Anopheles sinensis]|uniref:Peptidase n=1 Tax=Anopheles sinensis TaxID=74873 RepID=A0A084W2T2_ANOSI|nr:peptidase [Anopheles sinensis]